MYDYVNGKLHAICNFIGNLIPDYAVYPAVAVFFVFICFLIWKNAEDIKK